MLFREQRQQTAKETQRLTPDIIASTPGATAESNFYTELLPPLQQSKTTRDTRVHIRNGDTFTVAQRLAAGGQTNVAVLNMASDRHPGGGWLRGALAQEEALCLRSTLAATLEDLHYPTPPIAATWSPGVVVFRDEVVNDCQILEKSQRFVVGVVSVAGLRRPPLTGDGLDYGSPEHTEIMRNKIRQILRVMAVNGVSCCVLGALGCGAFGNPPKRVATLFREIISENEFIGYFSEIIFAILDQRREGNIQVFEDVIGDFVIQGSQ
ncbi:hypothetical protein PISL3812_08158 [Talaromyces islandicus]|uniref:Microbial-type PARG catalytic domain-containing protein n=1 Tax=Talaromyces islandicus TaxID=28573 RepID=A0A0U1M817_TALIS|nr:hypothetical protein PISL3812_08158 [Talaromyces islandicus]